VCVKAGLCINVSTSFTFVSMEWGVIKFGTTVITR